MATLTLTNSEVLQLCRLDTADATNIADATEVIGKAQDMYEAMIKPEVLANSSLTAFLRRNVSMLCAADLLDVRRRDDGGSVSLQGAGISVGKPAWLGEELRTQAMAALKSSLRDVGRPDSVNSTTDTSSAAQSAQSDLFGETEYNRRSPAEDGWG